MQQNTSEWLEWRNNGIGASDAPIIMGVSPWKTPYKLWLEKTTGQSDFSGNAATERGHALEDSARQCAEKHLSRLFLPQCSEHQKHPWMRASLDGISMDREILEIKCPYKPDHPSSDHNIAKQGKIPEKYYPQLQHQLEVAQAEKGWYFSFDGEDGVAVPFERDEDLIAELLEKEQAFWACVQEFKPPKMLDQDYQVIEEQEAIKKARKVFKLKKQLEVIQAELDPLEQELKDQYCKERCALIGDLRFTRFVRKGNINYNSVTELQGVNLEKYRNPSIVSFRISSVKK
jgi:putative phage-type endonuclease